MGKMGNLPIFNMLDAALDIKIFTGISKNSRKYRQTRIFAVFLLVQKLLQNSNSLENYGFFAKDR